VFCCVYLTVEAVVLIMMMIYHIKCMLALLVICCMSYDLLIDSLHINMIAHRSFNRKLTTINLKSLKSSYNNNNNNNYNNNKGRVCICMSSSTDDCRSPMRQCFAMLPSMSMAMKTSILGTGMLSIFCSIIPLAAVADGLQPGNKRSCR